MKTKTFLLALLALAWTACNSGEQNAGSTATTEEQPSAGGQEAVADDESRKDVVKIAVGSPDHTTLVAALKQADYVNDLANAGPFTVFAPTNDAFGKIPKETLENLMKDENKAQLQNILEYHVSVGVYKQEYMSDGQTINQANLKNITISIKDGKMMVNNSANVVATIPASNGIIYVVDAVLLPPAD
ncbi:MAG TPA: fasciclin domain-containing protein [Bacteroidia bacterium]|nr:fasciclin domain-containing protein [Bacteroidia bacterium]